MTQFRKIPNSNSLHIISKCPTNTSHRIIPRKSLSPRLFSLCSRVWGGRGQACEAMRVLCPHYPTLPFRPASDSCLCGPWLSARSYDTNFLVVFWGPSILLKALWTWKWLKAFHYCGAMFLIKNCVFVRLLLKFFVNL